MKCTNKKNKIYRKRRRKKNVAFRIFPFLLLILGVGLLVVLLLSNRTSVYAFEVENYNKNLYTGTLKVEQLCVATENITSDSIEVDSTLHAAALFRLDNANVILAENMHEKLYPASTTKILTIYLALKYGNLSDKVSISKNAVSVPLDSSRAGLRLGDELTLEALLYGLMLPSGNDSAVAVAEHISGSEKAFVALMNQEARKLGATNSNFINPHGYHDKNHYTTAYDLYLIFNECIKNETFIQIVSSSQHTTNITQKNGTYRTVTWRQSNQFINGTRDVPSGVTVLGGKTGTTDEAGACLLLYSKSENEEPYVSIIMGADSKASLYKNMTHLISTISK